MYPRLKNLRESLGMTQEEFGKSLNIAKSTYNNYETGIRDPKSDFWISVAKKYNVTVDYLMGFSDDPQGSSESAKKSPSTAEATPGEDVQRLLENLDGFLINMGYIGPDDDLTERQEEVLIGICRILRATFEKK